LTNNPELTIDNGQLTMGDAASPRWLLLCESIITPCGKGIAPCKSWHSVKQKAFGVGVNLKQQWVTVMQGLFIAHPSAQNLSSGDNPQAAHATQSAITNQCGRKPAAKIVNCPFSIVNCSFARNAIQPPF